MEETTSNWSDFPQPLLELILKPLTLPDHLRCASVCRSWRKAQRATLHHPAPHAPFLIVRGMINNIISSQLFSLSEKRMEKTPVPHRFCPQSTISSSGGWLLLQDSDDTHIKFLFNPFTNTRVDLPEAEEFVHYHYCLFFSTQADPDGALLVTKSNNKFLLCRLNDQSNRTFHQVEWKRTSFISNVVFFQGKLHGLNEDGSLVLADPLFATSEVKMGMKLQKSRLPEWHRFQGFYLVESCGQLLLVRVLVVHTGLSFDVFRADLTEWEWKEIENLGDRALFLSRKGSVSVCASETGCKANRIYYVPSVIEWSLYLFKQSNGMKGIYVEFELGKDGLDIPSIPGCDGVIGCDWLT